MFEPCLSWIFSFNQHSKPRWFGVGGSMMGSFHKTRNWDMCNLPKVMQLVVGLTASKVILWSSFLHVCVCVCVCVHAQPCLTLCDPMDCSPPGFSVHGFLSQGYWSGCHFLLRGIFPTQGSNSRLLHCRWILYHWVTWEAPRIKGNTLNNPLTVLPKICCSTNYDCFRLFYHCLSIGVKRL